MGDIGPLSDSPEGAWGVVGEPGSTWPTRGKRNVPPTPTPPGIGPLFDCADLLGCHKCGSDRVERFTVDRFIVLACADCGAYETETTRDR